MVLGTVLSLTTTLSLSCYYHPEQCINSTNFSHPPPVIMFGHQNQTLALNDMAILPCQVRGRVPSTISWYKDGIPLRLDVSADEDPSNERYRQLITGTLQILDLNKSDNGIYTCKAKNEDGETTWTASLTVAERNDPNILIQRMPEMEALPPAPGKPRVLNVTDETVELEWAEKHSATPIIGYIIQYWSPALKESWINVLDVVTTSRFRVKHLRPSHTYVFVVRAENSKGIGPPSEISDFVTTKQTLPDAERERFNELSLEAAHKRLSTEQLVKLVEVRALNATTMLLTWRRQRSEPLVHGYYIKWRGPPLAAPTAGNSPEHSWVNVSDPSAESALVGGLRPATHYEFFVIPYHHSVQGMPSNLLDGTTAEAVPSMPPSDVRLRMLNVTSLRVSWRPPPAHAMNGALKGFLINIRSNQSEERNITTNERATSVTLYRLIADASYAIQVAARTAAGYGPFFVGEPVVMNEETLQNHMRQASDMRHMDAWYRSSANVFILCAILWIMFLVLIVIIWYRCCHRRARHKNFDGGGGASTKDAREFIKIRDGSVVAIGGTPAGAAGTMARNATFWAASSDYNQHTGSSVALSAQMAGSDTCHDNSASCFASNCTGPINGSGMNACPHQHHHQHNYHHPNGHHVDGAGECVNCGAVYGASGSDYGTTLPTLAGTPYYAANGGPACGCAGLGVGAGPGGGGICNPAGCSTLQKPSMRSYSPSHHYHYAQLPDVLSSSNNTDALSTFHNQGSARQYYDDPSPYATTTLVMNNIPGSTHTPRTMHRGGTMAHVHHHFHQPQQHAGLMQPHYIHQHHSAASSSHGNLAAMMGNGGPLLPLNPIPKEPPRNFLSNAAMGAIITDAEMRNAPNWRKSAATAAACCGDVRAAHSGSCGELQDAQLSSKKASCTNCELLQNNYNNNKNKKSVSYNNNKLTQQSCCSIAGNQNLQCCISSTNIGNHSSNQCLRICGTRTTTHRASHHNIDSDCGDEVPPLSSPPPHNFQADYRGSPYTDVSYVQSSDGTNSSAKATKLSPPGNILDLVPPPPTDEPPPSMAAGFINGHAALYDAVSELCAAQKLKKFTPHHQKAYSAELNNNNSSRSSLHNVGSKAQRKGERYNSGSMSRARSRSNKSHQVKSRLSLVERDNDYHGEEDHGDDGVVLGDSALVALCHNRQSASKSGCEHDPLLVDSTGPVGAGGHAHLSRERGGAAGSEDTEADGELSEEERLPSCSSTTTTTMMPMMGIQVRCRTSPNAANTASAATAQ